MNSFFGLPLLILMVAVVQVHGQACPEGVNVAKMCVPGTYSGERVLIDTASYDPAVSNCSCTFGTNSSVMKLVTYVAPNFPECNSAIRLYSSSGNSIRFQCLMSGTYLDTSQYNAGVATFETYADYYDKNYCLVLEVAGRIDDTVTVTCTADVPEVFSATTVSSVHQDNTNASNDIVTKSNTENVDAATNLTTAANEVISSSVDVSSSIDQTTKEGAEEIATTTTASTKAEKLSSSATDSVIETTTDIAVQSTEARSDGTANGAEAVDVLPGDSAFSAAVKEIASKTASTGEEVVDVISGNSTVGVVAKENVDETSTTGVIANESRSVVLTVGTVVTETLSEATTVRVVTTETASAASEISSTSQLSSFTTTSRLSPGDHILSEKASNIPHELDIVFKSTMVNNIDNNNVTTHNASVEKVKLYDKNITSNITESKPEEDLSTLVTGTVLFKRGGTGLFKTIQNIDSVQADIFSDKNMTADKPEITTDGQMSNSDNSYKVSKDTPSQVDLSPNSDVIFTTVPTDISNSLVMGTSFPFIQSDITNISSNTSNPNDSNYSMKFPAYDPVEVPSNQSTENSTADPTLSYSYNTHNENNTLFLDTNYDRSSFVNDVKISSNETYTDNRTDLNIEIPSSLTNNLSVSMESSTFQNNADVNNVLSTEVTNKVFQTSPYIINEARLILESSEPADIIANIPIKNNDLVENTTHPMSNDFIIQNLNETVNRSEKRNVSSGSNLTDVELSETTLSGFQYELTHLAVHNRSQDGLPALNNQTEPEANAPTLFKSNITASLVNETSYSTSSLNETFDRNVDLIADPLTAFNMTLASVPTTPRSVDVVYDEQLNKNETFSDTDIAVNNTFAVSQGNDNFTVYASDSSNTGFEKRNTLEVSTYTMPVENMVENRSDVENVNYKYDIAHFANFTEKSNETVPIVGGSNEHMQASLIHNNVSAYEVNATESTKSSLGITGTHLQDNVNLFEERAVYPDTFNQSVDEVAIIHEGNETSGSYINQTGPVFVQKSVVYADTTSVPVNMPSTPVQSEREVSHLSFIHRMSDPYPANLTDTDIANENIENYTTSYIENTNIAGSTLNQTEADINNQSAFVSDRSALLYDAVSNESAYLPNAKDFSYTNSLHNLSEPAPEVNVSENSTTQMPDVITENVDDLTFIHRFDEPLIKSEHIPDMNLTQTLPNAADQGSFLDGETPNSYSLDVKTSEASPIGSGKDVEHLNFDHRSSKSASEMNITENSTTLVPDIVTENVDNLSFIHRFDETLVKTEQIPEINLTKTLSNASDQRAYLAGETTSSYSLNIQTSEATPAHKEKTIDHFSFVHRPSESALEINVTENTPIQLSDVVTENVNNISFIHRTDEALYKNAALPENKFTQSLTNTIYQELFSTSTYLPDAQSIEATLTGREVGSSSFEHSLNEPLAKDVVTGSTLDVMTEYANNAKFINLVSNNLLNDASPEIRTVKVDTSSSSSNLLETTSAGQTTVIANTVNEYMIDNSIDQHNFLSSVDAIPFDIHKGDVKSTTEETPYSTTVFIPTTTYNFEKHVQTKEKGKMNEKTIFKSSPTSTTSTSSDLVNPTTDPATSDFDGKTKSTTEFDPVVVEDMIVKENIKNVLSAVPENIANIQNSSDSVVPPDVLAEIEKQIIPEKKQTSPSVLLLETSSISTDITTSTTSSPKSVAHDTLNKNVNVNEADPEPIVPKLSSNIDDKLQTTPKQSLDMVEENVEDTSVTGKPDRSGLNVYFDAGKSKSSAFDMNNDTYIIVVGAIVGLVVLAVVIGIFCHNGRKRRSEKVNISGNTAEAPSHQNQAFDNETVNDVPGATATQNGGGTPEANGSASATDTNNGNVEL